MTAVRREVLDSPPQVPSLSYTCIGFAVAARRITVVEVAVLPDLLSSFFSLTRSSLELLFAGRWWTALWRAFARGLPTEPR